MYKKVTVVLEIGKDFLGKIQKIWLIENKFSKSLKFDNL